MGGGDHGQTEKYLSEKDVIFWNNFAIRGGGGLAHSIGFYQKKTKIFWHVLPQGGWGFTQSKKILSEKSRIPFLKENLNKKTVFSCRPQQIVFWAISLF